MTVKNWAANGWLRAHQSSRREIEGSPSIVDRNLHDARSDEISDNWRFGIAYNAMLKLCTLLLYASGYRAERAMHYLRTIHAMPLILGSRHEVDAAYLDRCRAERNTVEYDMAGAATTDDVTELIAFANEF